MTISFSCLLREERRRDDAPWAGGRDERAELAARSNVAGDRRRGSDDRTPVSCAAVNP
jgi:hypothetical protein